MDAMHPSGFKHTTLDEYPLDVAGITLVDEKPGFTGIYLRDPEGGLWPARTVSRKPASHHESVVDAWLSREGEHVDLRAKRGKKATVAQVKVMLRARGIVLSKKDGEYRVNFRGGREGTAYYTDDLADALSTGQAMVGQGEM